jgi:hypothetical protein
VGAVALEAIPKKIQEGNMAEAIIDKEISRVNI